MIFKCAKNSKYLHVHTQIQSNSRNGHPLKKLQPIRPHSLRFVISLNNAIIDLNNINTIYDTDLVFVNRSQLEREEGVYIAII